MHLYILSLCLCLYLSHLQLFFTQQEAGVQQIAWQRAEETPSKAWVLPGPGCLWALSSGQRA